MPTKTITYEAKRRSSLTGNNSIPCNVLRVPAYSEQFTKEENEIFKALSKNTHDSIWGEAIKLCIKAVREKSDYTKFKNLITSLISQAKDQPDVMKNIIGAEAFTLLCQQGSIHIAGDSEPCFYTAPIS